MVIVCDNIFYWYKTMYSNWDLGRLWSWSFSGALIFYQHILFSFSCVICIEILLNNRQLHWNNEIELNTFTNTLSRCYMGIMLYIIMFKDNGTIVGDSFSPFPSLFCEKECSAYYIFMVVHALFLFKEPNISFKTDIFQFFLNTLPSNLWQFHNRFM